MVLLGFILILLALGAAAFAAAAAGSSSATISLSAAGVKLSVTPLAMFLAGAAALLVLVLGLWLVSASLRRKAIRRRELRQLRREQAATAAAEEQARLDAERTPTRSAEAPVAPVDTADPGYSPAHRVSEHTVAHEPTTVIEPQAQRPVE